MHFFRFNLLQNYCKACKMRIFRSCNLSRITESSKLSNALSTRACSYYKGGFIYTFEFYSSIVFCLFGVMLFGQYQNGCSCSNLLITVVLYPTFWYRAKAVTKYEGPKKNFRCTVFSVFFSAASCKKTKKWCSCDVIKDVCT